MGARTDDPRPRPAAPRAVAWILLLASASAVLLVGILATLLLLGRSGSWRTTPWPFWPRLVVACGLTILSLSLRSLRWIFLLRRSETRIPIRDAYIGYLAGLSLLVAPFLLGEIAIRGAILRARGRVPVLTTAVVNVWERLLDLLTVSVVAALAAVATDRDGGWIYLVAAVFVVTLVPRVRRQVLLLLVAAAAWFTRRFDADPAPDFMRLASTSTWLAAFGTSIVVWLLPGAGLWALLGGGTIDLDFQAAEYAYAHSAMVAAISLAPGGVLIVGADMLGALASEGVPEPAAVLAVFGIRLATAGVAIALGILFVAIHVRTTRADRATHFDALADAYDVQIPESRRLALLERKTTLMRDILAARGSGSRGLDVGCGQGAYVERMRTFGFNVVGIDSSSGQVRFASRKVGDDVVRVGSVLDIPAEDDTFDFLYIINVLHHLGSIDEQRRAFAELVRVLKPGGLLFVHEINTRNVIFRFYMGYVFPSLNCIDEGVERWLLPDRLSQYTDARIVDVRYFTFLPDFMPRIIVRVLAPLERLLESSRAGVYSAHYMAVLEKAQPQRS